MSKNKKKSNKKSKHANPQVQQQKQEVVNQPTDTEVVVQAEQVAEQTSNTAEVTENKKGKNKVVEVKAKDVNKKKNKEKNKQPNKIAKALKDTGKELKKVSWPSFKEVVKQTGIVMVVVIVFTLVLFGIDRLCSLLAGLLIG